MNVKSFAMGLCLVCCPALAETAATTNTNTTNNAGTTGEMAKPDMSKMGPISRKVTHADKAGVDALYKAAHEAWTKGDINAMADLHDFPVTMVTDNAQGTWNQSEWNREKFVKIMSPMMTQPKGMKATEKHTPYFLSDTLASVEEEHTMTMNGKSHTFHSVAMVTKVGDTWKWKMGAEAGWGDMMKPAQGTGGSSESGMNNTGTLNNGMKPVTK